MSLRYLLDTNVVSAPLAKRPDPQTVEWLEREGPACALPAPAWHELVFGGARLPESRRRREIEEYLSEVVRRSFPILPYDETAAAWLGRERARLEALGRSLPHVDGQIAAIAATRGLTLVTWNRRDFEAYEGLVVIEPSPGD